VLERSRLAATGSAPERQAGTARAAVVLLALFLVSLPAVTPRIYASDEIQYFAYLRSLWFDRDLSFENEYRHFYDAGIARSAGFHETFLERTTETGRRINFGTVGSALLWAPFYAAGDAVARAMRAAGAEIAIDGYSRPYIAAVAYASAAYGFLALALAVAAVRRLSAAGSPLAGWSLPAALVVWLGTPLLFYMYVAPPMSHAPSAFAVSAFVLGWIVVRERWSLGGLAGLGVLAALMAMVREQDAFVVAGPALDLGIHALRTPPAGRLVLAGRALAGAVAAVVAYLPQAIAYLTLNGYVGPSRLVARKMTWTAPHALEVLLSPGHGFFIWTPLAAFALAGLAWLPRHAVRTRAAGVLTACLALAALLQVYVAGSVESWTVAGAFGQRRFVALTPLLVIGLAALGASIGRVRMRRVLLAGLALGVWWNVALMAQFGAGMMDRQRIEPRRVAYNAFVVLPRELPRLAWRYLFDRPSFYQQQQRLSEPR
jgi:hypothetical protein